MLHTEPTEMHAFMPDEIWSLILSHLPETDQLNVRAVSPRLKKISELPANWQHHEFYKEFLTLMDGELKKLHVPELVIRNIEEGFSKKILGLPEADYREILNGLVILNKTYHFSKETIKKLENAAQKYRRHWLFEKQKENLPKRCSPDYPVFFNVMGSVLCFSISLWLMLTITPPQEMASYSQCERIMSDNNDCQNGLTEALQKSLILFFAMGGTMGFFVRTLEFCLCEIGISLPSLPTPKQVLSSSLKENCRSFFSRAIKSKYPIAFSLSTILSITTAILKPFQVDLNNYVQGNNTLDQELLAANMQERFNRIGELSIPNAFLLIVSFIQLCVLAYGFSKKLTGDCHRFYQPASVPDQTNLNELAPLVASRNSLNV